MITCLLNEETALDMLIDRVEQWTNDEDVIKLYAEMYENYIASGCFDGIEFNVNAIVDNDFVNYCDVLYEDDERYESVKAFYDKNGLGDCSCEVEGIGYIEAENDGLFLIRV